MEPKQRHMLVIRTSAIGDVALCVPALEALVRSYSDLKITLLTREALSPFFRELSQVEIFPFDFKERHKGLPGIFRLFGDLRKKGITEVADLHNVLRSKMLCLLFWVFGRRVAQLDKGRKEKRALTRKFRKEFYQLMHMVERYCNVFRALGFQNIDPQPPQRIRHPLPAAIKTRKRGERWIGIAPFAKHKGKIYSTVKSDALIKLFVGQSNRLFIFGGGNYEREFADCMEERYPNSVTAVIDRFSIGEEMDIMSNLDCMISMDSSAMHICSLLGVPVVSIWGATHPYAGFYGFGQDAGNAVSAGLSCSPCSVYGSKPCLFRDYRCMERITPESIAFKVASVLRKSKTKSKTKHNERGNKDQM
jgi:ADP-heptose:LPS heptosyltransferase